MTGAFAHGAIFFIRDYNPEQNEDNVLVRMLDHNDVMLAFGTPEKQILIEPIFAQWIQSAHGNYQLVTT
ncbi:Photosystem I P700 chlorophyll a apoprotein A2 [Platanthera guangdongensis]|uniref:Photosystem I P700 chlorophyll a apoprotein A2 n=1 Tax=Platanthera guangdongensis TaxID=2320717 RepID=A0ABR2M477_9ASPA